MPSPTFWWIIIGLTLILCEFAVPRLILFFFGIGAIITGLFALFIPSLNLQLALFSLFSLLSLFGLRRILKPMFTGNTTDRNTDYMPEGMIGQRCTVETLIQPDSAGKVILNGASWRAESNETLQPGTRVIIQEQRSLTLIVTHIGEET